MSLHPSPPTGGGGGGFTCPTSMTIAALVALQTAGTLDPCLTYTVTDWTQPNLLGPNVLVAHATSANELSPDVLIKTPLGTQGPDRGEFNWAFPLMTRLQDSLGNDIRDTYGVGALQTFPWGAFAGGLTRWAANVWDSMLISSLADAQAAMAAGVVFQFTQGQVCNLGLSGAVNGSVANTDMGLNSSLTWSFGGGTGGLVIGKSQFGFGASISNTTATGVVTVQNSKIGAGASISAGLTGGITVDHCDLWASSSVMNTGDRELVVSDSHLSGGAITESRAGTPGSVTSVTRCRIDGSTVTWSGTVSPDQAMIDCDILQGSAVNLVDPDVAAAQVLTATVVEGQSTLNVDAGGQIAASRLSSGANLSTGAFAHVAVIIDGQFTTTLTANNTNTLQNKGFDDTV